MTKKTRKYCFANETEANSVIDTLRDDEGNITAAAIVKLGYLTVTPATYDDEGNELTAAVLSDVYAVDVYWDGEPLASWDQYIVWPVPMGIHSYGSSSSRDEYAAKYCELFPDSLYCNPPEPEEEDFI